MFGFSVITAPHAQMRHDVLIDRVRSRLHRCLWRKIDIKARRSVQKKMRKVRVFAAPPWRERDGWDIEF
jgi:hypothetical protein